jgi:hypothetical protein
MNLSTLPTIDFNSALTESIFVLRRFGYFFSKMDMLPSGCCSTFRYPPLARVNVNVNPITMSPFNLATFSLIPRSFNEYEYVIGDHKHKSLNQSCFCFYFCLLFAPTLPSLMTPSLHCTLCHPAVIWAFTLHRQLESIRFISCRLLRSTPLSDMFYGTKTGSSSCCGSKVGCSLGSEGVFSGGNSIGSKRTTLNGSPIFAINFLQFLPNGH